MAEEKESETEQGVPRPAMMIVFNGFPGVGKSSVAGILSDLIPNSRFFPNHLLIDPVAALLEREDKGYLKLRIDLAVIGVLETSYCFFLARSGKNITSLPSNSQRAPVLNAVATNQALLSRPVITTHYQQRVAYPGLTPDAFEFLDAANRANRPFISVILRCNEAENVSRLKNRPRGDTTKLADVDILLDLRKKHVLYSFLQDYERNPKIAGETVIDIDEVDMTTAAQMILDYSREAERRWWQDMENGNADKPSRSEPISEPSRGWFGWAFRLWRSESQ